MSKVEYRLSFYLEVAHYMPKAFDAGHPNSRVHGHTYHGEWVVVGDLDENGFVIEVDSAKNKLGNILKKYDHRLMNDIEGLENPTTENLSKKLYEDLKLVDSRTVAVVLNRPSVGLKIKYPFDGV